MVWGEVVKNDSESQKSRWCIVVADDHGAGWPTGPGYGRLPVQYCRLDRATTPLRRALHRAVAIASAPQVMMTALEEYRHCWESMAWFVRPERRFIGSSRLTSQFASAAAILSVAAHSPASIVTIMPARCYVTDEAILSRALNAAASELSCIPEGVVTLGMLDAHEGIDESYLIVGRTHGGRSFDLDGFARRPVSWVARHLKGQGALVASNIMVGYAGVFAEHVTRHWPRISKELESLGATAVAGGKECVIPSSLSRRVPKTVMNSLRWHPPAFRQRVMGVSRSGWSGLKSPRAVAQVANLLRMEVELRGEAAFPRAMLEASRDDSRMSHGLD